MQADTQSPETNSPSQRRSLHWGRLSMLCAAVILAVLASAGAWLLNSPDLLRTLAERAVTQLTGRTLAIGGEFSFELGREITLSAEQLTWANAPWSKDPAMLSIGKALLSVDLRSIVKPPLLITRVAGQDVQLYFEWNADDQSNWQIRTEDNPSGAPSAKAFEWLLEQGDLQNINVQIRPAGQSDELHIHIQELQQKESDLDLYPGQEMTLTASQINWTNPDWTTDPALLRVASIQATLDFNSVMQAPLIITDLTASDAQVDFEWAADGRFNWQFASADSKQADKSAHPLPVLLDKFALQNVAVRVQHPSQAEPLQIEIGQATQHQDDDKNLVTDIDMTVDGRPYQLDGRIGPFAELLSAGAVNLEMTLKGPYSTLNLQGDIAKLATLQKPNLRLAWDAPEVEKIFDMLNITVAASGKADLRGSVTPVGEGLEAQLEGSIGEFALNGSLHTDNVNQLEGITLGQLNGLKVNFQSTGPSAQAAGKLLAVDGLPPDPYELDIQMEDTDSGLEIKALRFAAAGAVATGSGLVHEFPSLKRLDFDLQMNVPNIARFKGLLPGQNIPALPFNVDGKIRSNADDSNDSLTASAALGPLKASLTGILTENPRFADSRFDWTLTAPDAQTSGAIFDIRLQQAVPLNASGKATVNPAGLNLRNTVVKLGTHAASFTGDLLLASEYPTVQLNGTVSGPDLRKLVNLFAVNEQIPGLPYNITTQLRYANAQLELKNTNGKLGSNTLKADGSLIFGKDWPVTDLRLSASGPRLDELLSAQDFAQLPKGTFNASGNLKITADSTSISQLYVETDSGVIRGSLNSGWPATPDLIDFDITAKGTNLAKVMPAIDGYKPAAVTFDIAAQGKLSKQQVNFPQLTAKLGDARINLQGHLDFSGDLRSDGAILSLSGPRLADLGTFDSWSLPEARFDLVATVAGAADKLVVNDFNLKYGLSDLRGKLQVTGKGKPRIDVIADSNRFDVRPFEDLYFGHTSAPTTAPQDGTIKPGKKSSQEPLIPDQPVPLKELDSVDGTLKLTTRQFASTRFLFSDLNISAKLDDGNLDFRGASSFKNSANTGDGSFQIAFQIQQQKGRLPHAEINVTARNAQYELNQLDPRLQGYNLIQNVDVYLIGDGANLREIAANINGYLWLRGGGQKIATNQFGFIFGDFLTGVLDKINPFAKKSPYQTIECALAFFEATDGILKTSPSALLSTETMNIGAEGTINLKNEKIAMNVQADPRKGIGISASSLINPFVGLRGTLSEPEITLDPTGTLIGGGAAVATGGLSIVAESLFKRWIKSGKPCTTIPEEAFKIRRKRDPAHVPAD